MVRFRIRTLTALCLIAGTVGGLVLGELMASRYEHNLLANLPGNFEITNLVIQPSAPCFL